MPISGSEAICVKYRVIARWNRTSECQQTWLLQHATVSLVYVAVIVYPPEMDSISDSIPCNELAMK